ERVGRDLGEDRDRALADVGRAGQHLEAPVAATPGAHGGAPGQPLLARAGEPGAVEVERVAAAALDRRAVAVHAVARGRRPRGLGGGGPARVGCGPTRRAAGRWRWCRRGAARDARGTPTAPRRARAPPCRSAARRRTWSAARRSRGTRRAADGWWRPPGRA